MNKNDLLTDTVITTAKGVAAAILRGDFSAADLRDDGPDSIAESIQALLSFAADTQVLAASPISIAVVEAILDFIFQEATPDQVVL